MTAKSMEKKDRWFKHSAVWRRIIADGGALAVGGNAAYLSWGHIVETSVLLHQPQDAAWLYPVSIDGMMIVGVVKAADDRAQGRKVRLWARVATWLGGALSINAQVMSALTYGALAAAWAVVPSVTLIVVVEVQSRRGKLLPAEEIPAVTAEPVAAPSVAPAVVVEETAVAPVESVPEPEPVVTETEPAAPPVEDVKPNRRPRRQRGMGHPGTGATGAQLDAAVEVTPARNTETVPVEA